MYKMLEILFSILTSIIYLFYAAINYLNATRFMMLLNAFYCFIFNKN